MKKTVMVAGGFLLPAIIGAYYYGLRHVALPCKKLDNLLELCSLYEGFLVRDWNNMQKAIFIIEDYKREIAVRNFPYADWLAELKQDQQHHLDLLLGIGYRWANAADSNTIVIDDE